MKMIGFELRGDNICSLIIEEGGGKRVRRNVQMSRFSVVLAQL